MGEAALRRDGLKTPAAARLVSQLVVTRRPGRTSQGILRAGSLAIPCALGRNGLTRFKREGDGATPVGRFRLLGGYIRQDRIGLAGQQLGLKPTPVGLGWCDEPLAANYNRPVRLPHAASHEDLRRADGLYDVVLVLDYNINPRRRGRGSAIFFHLARRDYAPTAGCVAITREDMRRLLPRLSSDTVMIIR